MSTAQCSQHTANPRSPISQASAPKKSTLLAKTMIYCNRGPEDYRTVEEQAEKTQAGQRLAKKRARPHASIKVGCTVCFALRTQTDTPDIAEIVYYNSDHSAACQVGS